MASTNNLSNGAFIVSRSIFESDIWFKPPEYFKIWMYLIGKANHSGRKYGGYFCERGQYFCDYQELRDQLEYKIGYRKKRYHENHMKNLMKYLRSTLRITTTKKPRGVLVTILNYDTYQTLNNYEKTSKKTSEETNCKPTVNQKPPSINKNDKELKNKYGRFFEERWQRYPVKDGKKEARKHFLATVKNEQDLENFDVALEKYLSHLKVKDWKNPKNGSTWFNNWQDWVNWSEPKRESSRKVLVL